MRVSIARVVLLLAASLATVRSLTPLQAHPTYLSCQPNSCGYLYAAHRDELDRDELRATSAPPALAAVVFAAGFRTRPAFPADDGRERPTPFRQLSGFVSGTLPTELGRLTRLGTLCAPIHVQCASVAPCCALVLPPPRPSAGRAPRSGSDERALPPSRAHLDCSTVFALSAPGAPSRPVPRASITPPGMRRQFGWSALNGTIPTELGRLTSVYNMCAQTWRARARTTILSYGLVAAMRPDCAGGSIATS